MKRFILVCLALALLFACCGPAIAAEAPPANQIASNLTSDSGEWFSTLRSSNFQISYTSYGIEKTSSSSVFVSATARTNETASVIGVLITVQRWANNRWNNYKSISGTSVGATSCSRSGTVSVASGYYYRIHVIYDASSGSNSQTLHRYSKSVLIQ